jgi:hypothetical protein
MNFWLLCSLVEQPGFPNCARVWYIPHHLAMACLQNTSKGAAGMSFAEPPKPGDGEFHSFFFILQVFKVKNWKTEKKSLFIFRQVYVFPLNGIWGGIAIYVREWGFSQ